MTVTRVTGLAVALVPNVSGKVTVCPTSGAAGEAAPMVMDAVVLTVTVTLPVCAAVVVGVVPPVVDAIPAVALTVVVRFVVNAV